MNERLLNYLIKINKDEKDYLVSKGFKYGEIIHKTYTSHPTYYMTTSPKAMKVLNSYRSNKLINKD